MQRYFGILGAFLAFLSVAGGAFGAHLLRQTLSPASLTLFEIGVRYQMYHAFALFVTAWAVGSFSTAWITTAGWLFLSGTLLFSGSLYALAFTEIRWLGAITPIGGTLLLMGWSCLLIGMLVG